MQTRLHASKVFIVPSRQTSPARGHEDCRRRATRTQGLVLAAVLIAALLIVGGAHAGPLSGDRETTLRTNAEGHLELSHSAPSTEGTEHRLAGAPLSDLQGPVALRTPPGVDRLTARVDGESFQAPDVGIEHPTPPMTRGPLPSPSGCDLDWRTFGGTARRDGNGPSVGPGRPRVHWSGSRPSIIAWPMFFDGKAAFTVRQASFQEPGGSLIVALDRATGEELWTADLPYEAGDWHIWIAGVAKGKVYASRSGNGSSVSAKLFALSANDGSILWESQDDITSGAYDGVVFGDGDLILGSFSTLTRISASDGHTVWNSTRQCSVSNSCGAVVAGKAVYIADVVFGGHQLVRYKLSTGERLYASEIMPGFTLQDMPFVGADGTVYLARTQSNSAVDYLYAFDDLDDSFALRWSVPSAWVTYSVHAVPGDDTLYMMGPGYELLRLEAESGDELASAGVLEGFFTPRMAVDTAGKLYVSDGVTSLDEPGVLYGFNADLTPRWKRDVSRINIGGPSLGIDGFLTVAGVDTDLRAYKNFRSAPACR